MSAVLDHSPSDRALERVKRVRVDVAGRRVRIEVANPLCSNALNEVDGRRFASELSQYYLDLCQLREICREHFREACTCEWNVGVVDHLLSSDELQMITKLLCDGYSRKEPVAGKLLCQAQVVPRTEERNGQVELRFAAQAVVDKLAQKDVIGWLTRESQEMFGLSLSFTLHVSRESEEELAELRSRLQAEEEERVQQLLAEEETRIRAREAEDRSGNKPGRDAGVESAEPFVVGQMYPDPEPIPIREIVDEMRRASIVGRVFRHERRTLASGRTLIQFNITDFTDSISAKMFVQHEKDLAALETFGDGVWVKLQGQVQFDTYAKEIVFMAQAMRPEPAPVRRDEAENKRIELHAHTVMSAQDGVVSAADLVRRAAAWGHPAIAITDHGGVQSFPEAYGAAKKQGIRLLLGVEAYVVDDGGLVVYREREQPFTDETIFVVFDTETTGLNAREDTLIEIAAVKVRGGEIVDTYASLIDPERPLSPKITELTGISNDMVKGQPKLADVLAKFREFVQGSILVAHNAEFDVGFLNQCAERLGMPAWEEPVIDTLALARALYPGEKNYKLKTLTQKFSVELVNHHRALADSEATAKVFLHMLKDCKERGLVDLSHLNQLRGQVDIARVRPFHATILVRNRDGLRNLYRLVSMANTEYLHRIPRLPKSVLAQFREGLLIGTACRQGELIESFIRGKSIDEIEALCEFYDYLEIQPPSHYEPLIRDEVLPSFEHVRELLRQIVDMGKRLNKPVVATGDVHFLDEHDHVYREIFLQSQKLDTKQPPLYFRTTDEMLAEFSFLGEEDARSVVIDQPQAVAQLCEDVKPIPDDLHTPVIEGAEEEIRTLSYRKATAIYGSPLPEIVEKRLEKELHSIISNGFSVIYLIAHKLVTKSLTDGYLVGSRGSVGSSLVATMTDITEVNPLPPHYVCPNCQYSEFFLQGEYGSGFDLPEKACPHCGTSLRKDGQDIPFETFLGFDGDKVPDIDLNFSGEYQPRAHRYTEELFGKDHVFRAGTISVVAEKTAYGYVRKYAEEKGLVLRNAEIERLVQGCTGVKRTTGQHPGGQVVVPNYVEIYDFTPIQYPADDRSAETFTTHFDYHSGLENCLLKLDILGHDDPTVIRMLQDLTGVDPKTIPLDDPDVLALFRGTEPLGVTPEEIRSVTGTYAIPEFGTRFVRQMLEDTRPTTFSELVRISGLSHGTDVWLNNAQALIREGIATLSEVICARDDIMIYLIQKGLDPARAFKIMEGIRKGKGVKPEDEAYMREHNVPDWYIESGKKIKYMFPKAHAAAYVLMAVRIAWFKVHHPLAFYATYFTVRADDFDIALMTKGRDAILAKIDEIESKGNAALPKEKSFVTVLEVALEMVARGYRFLPVNLYKSDATRFLIDEREQALIPPFVAISGVGETAARNLYEAAQQGEFLSLEDLQTRGRVSKTVVDLLTELGCLEGLPETNQLSLF
ncbi:DNA polymerase III PolC-type [Alicyclobacillus hesperidum subsp. aegles]|uniref:PolC-type DNA polymerase III n=1 Tax=Alicyclobacillus hesperidum TaxID=89784 RepID=UPI00222AE49F|nr:PolC-type DNA polymerase III [Alicyclobacillus hesperidum]GLG00595.1 DNA polymerase III PolC-type [Alicyclobacillus hesperidum subsp. aegles]